MNARDVTLAPRRIEIQATLHARETAAGDRIIEGRIVPFGEIATVRDLDARTMRPIGRAYRETIVGVHDWDPSAIVLEWPGHRGPIAGRGTDGRTVAGDGAYVAFRILATQAGNDLYEIAREGLAGPLSIEYEPHSPATVRHDGVKEVRAVIRRVAGVERGAYAGAQITAVRADVEGEEMADDQETAAAITPAQPQTPPAAAVLTGDGITAARTSTPAPLALADGPEVLAARQAAERAAAASIRQASPAHVTRDELVYGPGGRSFLGDLVRMREGDLEAIQAMTRHYALLAEISEAVAQRGSYDGFDQLVMARTGVWVGDPSSVHARGIAGRAGEVLASEIPGAYPNTYLPGLLTPRILKGRPMGGFYQRVPISDARPQIFPKVTTSTTAAVQSAEGANPAASDFGTTAVTANPLLYGAETVLSRQVIDGASPAAEQMVLADMAEAYGQASEAVIKTAVEAGSTASGVAVTIATPFAGIQANVINYFAVRFSGAQAVFAPTAGFTTLLAENDTTGRPKMPWLGPVNSDATVQGGAVGGSMLGAEVKLSYQSTANVWVFGTPSDFVIFESPVARFSYDAVTGPAGVRIGIWAYLVVGARLGSLKVTAA